MKPNNINFIRVTKLAIIFILALIIIFPFYMTLTMAFKARVDITDPGAWLFSPTLKNFVKVFQREQTLRYFYNSLIVVLSTVAISLIFGTMSGYALARLNIRRKKDLAFLILSFRMLPPIVGVVPFFIIAVLLGLLDTRVVLIIAYLTFNIPFATWMMRSFIEKIPVALEESAKIDGASRIQVFGKIILPLVTPGLAATATLCFIQSWNEFVFATFLTSLRASTLPTLVTYFMSHRGVVWGEMAVIALFISAPVIIFAILTQKNLVKGLALGAIE